MGRLIRRFIGPCGRPDEAQAGLAGLGGYLSSHLDGGAVQVRLRRRIRLAGRDPVVEGDRHLEDLIGKNGRVVREPQLVDRLLRVVGREGLLYPAVGDEIAVEPHVGDLMKDHVRIGEVRNENLAGREVVRTGESQVLA